MGVVVVGTGLSKEKMKGIICWYLNIV